MSGSDLVAPALAEAASSRTPRQDLSQDTYVRFLGPDGSPRWTWLAPGPQERLPWLGSDGLVHLISEGQLFTLPRVVGG